MVQADRREEGGRQAENHRVEIRDETRLDRLATSEEGEALDDRADAEAGRATDGRVRADREDRADRDQEADRVRPERDAGPEGGDDDAAEGRAKDRGNLDEELAQ